LFYCFSERKNKARKIFSAKLSV